MLHLSDLRSRLFDDIRGRIRNGELTERGLAGLIGISQPHMHNILKGTRGLSLEVADLLMQRLHLSVLDFVHQAEWDSRGLSGMGSPPDYALLPMIEGSAGPSHPWPLGLGQKGGKFKIAAAELASMFEPVVVQTGHDPQMTSVFSAGDYALLDQSLAVRTHITPWVLYLIKQGDCGLVRFLRHDGDSLWIITEEDRKAPAKGEEFPLANFQIQYVVRARVRLIVPAPGGSGSVIGRPEPV